VNLSVKKFENRSTFGEVMGKLLWLVFWLTVYITHKIGTEIERPSSGQCRQSFSSLKASGECSEYFPK